jgi:molybdopterin-guanine dinucleotide biosynthesis protein A
VLASLRGVVSSVVLAGRAGQAFPEVDAPLRVDRYPGAGPLAGLEALLADPPAPWCWLVASDMPRFDAGLLAVLAPARGDRQIVVPEASGRLHPTCALYEASLLGEVRRRLAAGERSLHRLIEAVPHARVSVAGALASALFNVNEDAELSDLHRDARD